MTNRTLRSGTYTLGLLGTLSLAAAISGASCSDPAPPSNASSSSSGAAGAGGTGGMGSTSGSTSGSGGSGGSIVMGCPCTDLPEKPIFQDGLTAEVGTAFDAAMDMPAGPCISEPASDAMVPRNWSPLLIEWVAPIDQNVFQVRVEVDNQVNPLVVYTNKPTYTIPSGMWKSLTNNSAGHDLKITVRGARIENGAITAGPFLSETTILHIAPIDAPGSIVYWAYEPVTKGTFFRGFTVGDETPKEVLTPEKAGTNAGGKVTGCISCHTSSPDGKIMFYSSDDPPATYRSIDARLVKDQTKPTSDMISDAAWALLGRHRQLAPIVSPAHWSANDAVVISVYAVDPSPFQDLIWTDLHAVDSNGWGKIPRINDGRNPTSATWSHDGKDIAYVSSKGGHEGVIAETVPGDATMDIYVVPYNDRQGGVSLPLPGASDPVKREFYPIYSPDDVFLAFNRSDTAPTSYDQATAEVFLIPRAGGEPTRLKANDPPACTGLKSPGITNSWSRWAPQAPTFGGLRYYWLVFSSKRRAASGYKAQLYMAAITTKFENGMEVVVGDYPAVYFGPQNANESNHTPVWDNFVVDQIIPK